MGSEDDIKKMSVEKGLVESLIELRDALKGGAKLEERYTIADKSSPVAESQGPGGPPMNCYSTREAAESAARDAKGGK